MRRAPFIASTSLVAVLQVAACGRTTHSVDDDGNTGGRDDDSSEPGPSGGRGEGGSDASSGGSAGAQGTSGSAGEHGTGGAGALGGAGGEPTVPQRSLAGTYDISVSELPSLSNCWIRLDGQHLTFWVDQASYGVSAVWLMQDFQDASTVQFELDADTLATKAHTEWYTHDIDRPRLELDLDEDGFSGTGRIDVPFDCGDYDNATVTVPVTIGPDVTPPAAHLHTWLPSGVQVAGEPLSHEFTEPVFLNGDRIPFSGMSFATSGIAELLTKVVDLDGNPLAVDWRTDSPYFSFPASAAGHTYDVGFDARLTDRAGNPLTTTHRLAILDPGETKTLIDFESENHPGGWGNAWQVPAGVPDSPCESGACFVLEGVGQVGSIDAAVAVQLPYAVENQFEYRYRLWVDTPLEELENAPNVVAYNSHCMLWGQNWSFEPVSDGPYVLATPWATQTNAACGHDGLMTHVFYVGAEPGVGYRLAFEWFSTSPAPLTP